MQFWHLLTIEEAYWQNMLLNLKEIDFVVCLSNLFIKQPLHEYGDINYTGINGGQGVKHLLRFGISMWKSAVTGYRITPSVEPWNNEVGFLLLCIVPPEYLSDKKFCSKISKFCFHDIYISILWLTLDRLHAVLAVWCWSFPHLLYLQALLSSLYPPGKNHSAATL